MPANVQGVGAGRFSVVPRTLLFLFDENGRVLLLKGAADKRLWAGKYNGLGGHIEPGEDILEGAWRELAEEAGIGDVPLRLCGQIMITVNRAQGIAVFIFKGQAASDLILKNSIEGELEWVPLKEIATRPMVPDLYEVLPKVAAHQENDPLIVGKFTYDKGDRLVISLR